MTVAMKETVVEEVAIRTTTEEPKEGFISKVKGLPGRFLSSCKKHKKGVLALAVGGTVAAAVAGTLAATRDDPIDDCDWTEIEGDVPPDDGTFIEEDCC